MGFNSGFKGLTGVSRSPGIAS